MSLNAMLENYIRHVHIENFRSLANVDVDLLPLTVLVGANGSGKSNFIDALRFVRDALLLTPRIAVSNEGGFEGLRVENILKSSPEVTVGLTMTQSGINKAYGFTLIPSSKSATSPVILVKHEYYKIEQELILEVNEGTFGTNADGDPLRLQGLWLYAYSNNSDYLPAYRLLTEQQYFRLYPNQLRFLSSAKDNPRLDTDGRNLEFALGFFLNSSEWAQDLINSLIAIVPQIIAVQAEYNVDRYEVYMAHSDGSRLRLQQESDGTLRVIALLLALYDERSSSSLIAIEEPELAVHPDALGVLVDVIEEAALSTQVIITTHSPDLIAQFRAENLRIVEWTDEGTKIGPLEERQRAVIERQLFDAGELLRIEGLARAPKGS